MSTSRFPTEPGFEPAFDEGLAQPVEHAATYTGHPVLDEQSHHVGKVTDVIYDDLASDQADSVNAEPAWLVVDPGILRGAHYVPVAGSYRTEDGAIVVPWDREWIKASTKASGDHILSDVERLELGIHYATT